jgi:predicted ATPase
MLKRIKIQGYKSLADVEVHLQPLTVLFGPNASGKSNFLDALQLLSRIATSDNIKYAFEPPYRGKLIESFTFGNDGIPGVLAKERVRFSFEVDVELSQEIIENVNQAISPFNLDESGNLKKLPPVEKYLRYHIVIEMLPQSAVLQIADESLVALNNATVPKTEIPIFNRKDIRRDLVPTRGMFASNPSFLYPPDFQYWSAMHQELANWSFFYLEPRERMRIPSTLKEVTQIGTMGEDLAAFLYTLRAADVVQFKAIVNALNMVIPSITNIDTSVDNFGDVELALLEGQTPISSRIVSEGTLRILGLLALSSAKEGTSLIGFEEPENGINPRRLRLIASLLQTQARHNKQMIVTTHSPLLTDLVPHNSLYVCRKKSGRTIIEPLTKWDYPDVNDALDSEEELTVSERTLRGDFDA